MSFHNIAPGDTLHMAPELPAAGAPTDVRNFLGGRGWAMVYGERWEHDAKGRPSMTWEQAMACEFYEFITIGGR